VLRCCDDVNSNVDRMLRPSNDDDDDDDDDESFGSNSREKVEVAVVVAYAGHFHVICRDRLTLDP
jgi:hypothetical protein